MQKEIWIEHPSETEGTSFTKFEISNFGRLKIYNHLSPEGRITNGSIVGGVPSYIYKTYKPISEKNAAKMAEIDQKYQQAREMVAKFRYQSQKLEEYKKLRNKLKEQKKKLNKKIQYERESSVALILHRLVAHYFLEKPEDENAEFVIHKDYDRTNNHVDNLEWATQEQITARHPNQPKLILHRFKMQMNNIPTPTPNSKLSENDVLYIKKRLKKNDSVVKLAQRFSVSKTTISNIKSEKSWKNIKLVEDLVEDRKKK